MTPETLEPRKDWRGLGAVDAPGRFAMAAMVLMTLTQVAYAWTSWNGYGLVQEYFAGTGSMAAIESGDSVALTAGWISNGALALAGVVFLVWLWRARVNSEQISSRPHARSRGWTIGGWFVPVVSFWFPFQVVRDVWRASDPQREPKYDDPILRSQWNGKSLLGWWWAAFLVCGIASTVSWRLYRQGPGTTPEEVLAWLRSMAVADTVATLATVLALVGILAIIRQITRWQHALRDQPHGVETEPAA